MGQGKGFWSTFGGPVLALVLALVSGTSDGWEAGMWPPRRPSRPVLAGSSPPAKCMRGLGRGQTFRHVREERAAALSTLYLGQLGTQACPPPGEVSRAGPGRPCRPGLYLRTHIPQGPLQQDRSRATAAGVMSVRLPVCAGPKVTSCWQVVKMPSGQGTKKGEGAGPKVRSRLKSCVTLDRHPCLSEPQSASPEPGTGLP